MILAVPLSTFALRFGPPEYFGLICLGMILVVYLAQKSVQKALISALLGIFLSQIGIDQVSSAQRFTFGMGELFDGISMVPLIMGLFGLGEVFLSLEEEISKISVITHVKNLLPNLKDWKDSSWPIVRGSILGFLLGVLPGGGPVLSSFASYGIEKRVSKRPELFGHGAIEGVAGPEAANNSATGGSFVPLLTLGIPFAVPAAIMLAGLRMHNVEPGPMLFTTRPDMFWTFIAAMYIGNLMLLILNLPLVGLFGKIAVIRPAIVMPVVSLICLIGMYSVRNSFFDVWIMIIAGIVGFFLRRWKFPVAPFIIGAVLESTTENSVRQSLMLFKGNPLLIAGRPIAMTLLVFTIVFIIYRIVSSLLGKKITLGGEEPG
jgi:putative tricarboxylic transport membrane protein